MTAQAAYDVFNGDADGICALHQLRLAVPRDAVLITGAKRDIALGQRLPEGQALDVTLLDVSFDKNVDAVHQVLAAGGHVFYADHHAASMLFPHPQLDAHIDTSGSVCTSLLINRYLAGAHQSWALAGAFGDNLGRVARALAVQQGLPMEQMEVLARLGMLLNYNAYGDSIADLHVPPSELYTAVHQFESPFDFVQQSQAYRRIAQGYEEDRQHVQTLAPQQRSPHASVFLLPAEAWARRLSGTLANELVAQDRLRSVAVLTPRAQGGYVVSVRVASSCVASAEALCSQYPTGGGRVGAAGIDHLPDADMDRFMFQFFQHAAGGSR